MRLALLRQSARRDVYDFKPIILDEETFKTQFLQSYLLLLSIVQMRKIMKVPSTPALFRHMHKTIYRSVVTLQVIAMLSKPPEFYLNLAASSHMQKELISTSFILVNDLNDLEEDLKSLQDFDPEVDIHENGAHKYLDRIGFILYSIQDVIEKYEETAATASYLTGPEVKVYELPGVMDTMKRIRAIITPFKNVGLDVVILDEITNDWPMQE
ncbi:hypothetical protein J3R30DRAFT_3700796 [Lentinula aciculospora]|uniref:Terpenoid synthase n=1 Tax=Lentinula aciculospora TaxID=153920 RepID=A0A9W9AG14_9AGAR|nr:hypothetical protein J3R30DRAFT_3700796 [Lentinula aciculospora]